MSLSITLTALWAVAATTVALLPMQRQYLPGGALLLIAPGLIVFLGVQHGWIAATAGMLGLASMFRTPLRHYGSIWRARVLTKEPK